MATGIPQDQELRAAIEAFGDAILPFAKWVPSAQVPSSVWAFGAYQVLDEIIGDSDFDEDLIERWKVVAAKPLDGFPASDPSDPPQTAEQWRADHGFAEPPIFDMDSKNRPIGRRAFYSAYWAIFRDAVRSAKMEPNFTWLAFANQLLTGAGAPHWPAGGVKPDQFMRALVRDITIAVLGMKNWDATSNPSKDVFLRALGEGRFVGNKYARNEIEAATAKISQQLDSKWREGEPS